MDRVPLAEYAGRMTTFPVSDVTKAVDPIPPLSLREAVEALGDGPVEALGGPSRPLVRAWTSRRVKRGDAIAHELAAYHPFVAAVHAAFSDHRPLVLGPDAVWLMIAQGLAFHVQANAEQQRSRIVAHEGRELVWVRRDDFVKGAAENPWPEVFAALSVQVKERTGALHELALADFSTTDAIARSASEIALLSAAQPYFAL